MADKQKFHFWERLFHLGLTDKLRPYQYSMGYVFNVLNFTGIIISTIRFAYILLAQKDLDIYMALLQLSPLFICLFMMLLMYRRAYAATVTFSFAVFPILLLYISISTHDRGLFTYLIPYMVYSFFFLNSRKKIFAAFSFVAIFFITAIVIEIGGFNNAGGKVVEHDIVLEAISLMGTLVLTFLSLYSIKFQVWKYQSKIREQRNQLETSRQNIEEQNKRLEHLNQLKDKLFSIISHDLRVPLTGMQMMLESVKDDDKKLATLKQLLPELREEMRYTNNLFENLLNWSKLQLKETSISHQPVNISELSFKIAESLRSKAHEKGVVINTDISETYINADRDVLEIVLRNIISNAIKFTETDDSIAISGEWNKDAFTIKVSDTGRGMSEEAINKIQSNSFYTSPGTRNEKGTGLGLIICKDLIERCHGNLSIESSKGKGTTLSIMLPQNGVHN